jgi:hypothetical protein
VQQDITWYNASAGTCSRTFLGIMLCRIVQQDITWYNAVAGQCSRTSLVIMLEQDSVEGHH